MEDVLRSFLLLRSYFLWSRKIEALLTPNSVWRLDGKYEFGASRGEVEIELLFFA